MKKIIFFTKSIDGGTGKFFLDLMTFKKLSYFEDNTTFLYYCLEKPQFRKVDRKNIHFFHSSPHYYPLTFGLTITNVLMFVRDVIDVNKRIRIEKPHIVFCIDAYCNILLLVNKVVFRQTVKTICTTHINLASTIKEKSSKSLSFFLKIIIHFFYLRADALICVSEDLRRDLKKYFNITKKIQAISYGYSLKAFSIRPNVGKSKTIFVSIGRLVPQKDFNTLIKAFYLVHKVKSNSILWIVGDGKEKPQLKEMVNKLKLRNKVLFFGWKQNPEKILRNADIFVFSSKREGFPYVLLEALSAGLPVISTNTPFGPSEILDNGKYGILVPMGDEKKMSDSMSSLISNNKVYKYYAQKSLERAKFFTVEKMLNSYAIILKKLLSQP